MEIEIEKRFARTARLRRKHGDVLLRDFEDLFTRPLWNLSQIGKKYNFSRERARQIFYELYGVGYSSISKEKLRHHHRNLRLCSMFWPPRTLPLLKKCRDLNLQIECIGSDHNLFLLENRKVRFYCAYTTIECHGIKYAHIRALGDKDNYEFAIVLALDTFYVIPNSDFGTEIYIRTSEYVQGYVPDGRNWSRYMEAWNLLRPCRSWVEEGIRGVG